MRTSRKTTAVVLTGAIGVASVAYGLGTQVGDGAAVAEGDSRQNGSVRDARGFGRPGHRDAGLESLADELGVSADKLEQAFRDFHEQKDSNRGAAFAEALGKALGKSAEEVQAAFDQLAEKREARIAKRLADALGLEPDKVAAALSELRESRKRGEGRDFPAELAKKLGVSQRRLFNAFDEARPGRGDHHHGLPLRRLAAALDVTRAELRKAFRALRDDADSIAKDHRAELVKFLAERLGIAEDKVDEALPEFAGPGGHRGGPGGDGPPFGPGGRMHGGPNGDGPPFGPGGGPRDGPPFGAGVPG